MWIYLICNSQLLFKLHFEPIDNLLTVYIFVQIVFENRVDFYSRSQFILMLGLIDKY
jgi:hypothetical protein